MTIISEEVLSCRLRGPSPQLKSLVRDTLEKVMSHRPSVIYIIISGGPH